MGDVAEVTVTLPPPAADALIEGLVLSPFLDRLEKASHATIRSYRDWAPHRDAIAEAEKPLDALGWKTDPGERGPISYAADRDELRELVVETLADWMGDDIANAMSSYKRGEGTVDLRERATRALALADVLDEIDDPPAPRKLALGERELEILTEELSNWVYVSTDLAPNSLSRSTRDRVRDAIRFMDAVEDGSLAGLPDELLRWVVASIEPYIQGGIDDTEARIADPDPANPAGVVEEDQRILARDLEAALDLPQGSRGAGELMARARGTGSLIVRRDKSGREVFYGKWWVRERQVMKKLGVKRRDGTREGLTLAQANRELQRRILEGGHGGPPVERLTVSQVGERYIRQLEGRGLKPSTTQDYRSTLRVHLTRFFPGPIEKIDEADVEAFIAAKVAEKKAPKSVRNYLGLLHSLFAYAEKKGWAHGNPVKRVEKPRAGSGDPDIRFLDQDELDALIRAVPDDVLGGLEGVLYLTAAMTGLRQGELIGLRWRDIDWTAGRVRVRQSYVRGEFGTPKSKRSSRSVPLADEVAGALDRHFKASAYTTDDDLVFCHPHTGNPLDRSKLLKRFKSALKRAKVRPVRFHDLRHTFGTRMAAAGVSLRTVQEWMGHRDFKTTLIYADYAPDAHERELVQRAFARRSTNGSTELSQTEVT